VSSVFKTIHVICVNMFSKVQNDCTYEINELVTFIFKKVTCEMCEYVVKSGARIIVHMRVMHW